MAGARTQHVTPSAPYARDIQVFGGFDTYQPPQQYMWDGMKRGADAAHPYLVFQYTLEGWGCYASKNLTHRLGPGMAFTAIIPSEHTYYLPKASSGWTFFWIIVRHPYVVERLIRHQQESGAVLAAEPNSALIMRAFDLLAHFYRPTTHDTLALERALFEFLWEHERAARRESGTENEAERLLSDVRSYVRESLPRPLAATDLAARHGKSRSHFSHIFKRATGIGPAHFIQQIRLEEATRRLIHTDQTISIIARETGFANANHFCKVFRQHFHLSPGAFRKQLR
ncbi:MAG: hypothetical protein NVS2B7_34350 [Herpetosiphon sp.]